MKFELILIFYY